MSSGIHIQLLGTLSSRYSYIKHVMQKVIERAQITVQWEDINDLSEIISRNIEVVPTLLIDNKGFQFKANQNINPTLKDAMLYLLRKGDFHNWPFFIVAGKSLNSTKNPFLFAYFLAIQFQAAIEVNEVNEEKPTNLNNPFPLLPVHTHTSFKDSDHNTILSSILKEPLIGTYENTLIIEEIRDLLPYYDRTLSLVVSKDPSDAICEEPDCLIRRAVDGGKVPVIFTSSNTQQEDLSKILLVAHSKKEAFQIHFLNRLMDAFSAQVTTINSPTSEFAEAYISKEQNQLSSEKKALAEHKIQAMVEKLTSSLEVADLYAFQLKNHNCLERLIQNADFIEWFKNQKQAILFLPFQD